MNQFQHPAIGIVGLWHLGCTIAVCWADKGFLVKGVDADEAIINNLRQGQPPLFEPGLSESIQKNLDAGSLSFSTSLEDIKGCQFVFVAYDTPVKEDDESDIRIIQETVIGMAPFLDSETIIIISAQLPLGTARALRVLLKKIEPSLELVYSPENLRLGQALRCYSQPGHIVIGSDDLRAADKVEKLFSPMNAKCLKMNLPSAEMAKHAINTFLATSITLANQWADLCEASGASYFDVASAIKHDHRIGEKAYVTQGIGFSGGTLGRDLKVLDRYNREYSENLGPLFGQVWDYNATRFEVVKRKCEKVLGGIQGKIITLLGMTYKPGTSTLRRSLPLDVAEDLINNGSIIRAYDPKADWDSVSLPSGLQVCRSSLEAAKGSEILILLTDWPEFLELDFSGLMQNMKQANFFDTKNMLKNQYSKLEAMGFEIFTIGEP